MGYKRLIAILVLMITSVAVTVLSAVYNYSWIMVAGLLSTCLLFYLAIRTYSGNIRKLNYLLSAFENGDLSFSFAENSRFLEDRIFNILLNRVRGFVKEQHRISLRAETFHIAVENLSSTGIIGVNSKGEIRCSNKALESVIGIPSLHHISQVGKIHPGLPERLAAMDENSEIRIDVSTDQKKYTMQVECRLLNDGTSPIRVYLFNEAPSEEEQQESNSWHRMTRILSHEVMNTITPIVSLTDTLYEKSSDEEVREGLSIIRESSRGLLGFVNGYRALSKVPTPNIRPFKLKELTDGLVSHFSNEIERMKVTVTSSYEDPEMVLFADEQLTRQILINLFRNALNALSNRFCDVGKDIAASGPFISITVSTNLRDNTQIVISNNGTPIPIFHQDKIFEPFFTTKKEGTGIGLALSRQIMRAHNGTINLTASDERQTTFTITF